MRKAGSFVHKDFKESCPLEIQSYIIQLWEAVSRIIHGLNVDLMINIGSMYLQFHHRLFKYGPQGHKGNLIPSK